MKTIYKTLLTGLAYLLLQSAVQAQFYEVVPLGLNDTLIVTPDSDSLAVIFNGGTLILQGNFDKETQFPLDNGSFFPQIMNVDSMNNGSGTLVFRNCALLQAAPGESKGFYHLPITYARINLVFENSWLYGDTLGVDFDGRYTMTPRSGLYAYDTWFSCGSEGVLSRDLTNIGEFSHCRFALGDTGVRINNGVLSFANCEFVSLNTGISISGTGSLNLSNCLFQSCRTMLDLSDSVTVAIDSSSFYEVESFCLAASSDSSLMDISVNHCWFDSSSIANDQLLENLPAGIITDPAPAALMESVEPVDIVIHVDDSEPFESAGSDSLRVFLSAELTLRDTGTGPIKPRNVRLYALPVSLAGDNLQDFLANPLIRSEYFVGKIPLEMLEAESLPGSEAYGLSLPSIDLPLGSYILTGTVDDEF